METTINNLCAKTNVIKPFADSWQRGFHSVNKKHLQFVTGIQYLQWGSVIPSEVHKHLTPLKSYISTQLWISVPKTYGQIIWVGQSLN